MPKVVRKFYRDGVEYKIKFPVPPIYRYTPGANTVVYLPMDTDLNDHGPSSVTISNYNSVSISGVYEDSKFPVAYFGGASRYLYFTNPYGMTGAWTINAWVNLDSSAQQWITTMGGGGTRNKTLHCGYSEASRGCVLAFYSNDMDSNSTSGADGNWHMITFTYNGGGSTIIYIDAVVLKSGSLSGLSPSSTTTWIGDYIGSGYTLNGHMSEYFIEKIQRPRSSIQEFFNNTKSNYGK